MNKTKSQINNKSQTGFTLIELLVVISIIGLLASVVLVSLNSARTKARDAKRVADLNQLSKAMQLYFNDYGGYPPNLDTTLPIDEVCDRDHNTALYDQMIQTYFINNGYIASIPRSPSGGSTRAYCYFNYGGSVGGLWVTSLETINATTVGPYNSCRPFDNNWCSNLNSNRDFCLCNSY